MGILSSTVSLTRYRVNGALGDTPIERVEQGLKKHTIQDIGKEPIEIMSGWTSLFDPFTPDFNGSSFLVASYFVFALRIDKKSVPSKVLKQKYIVEEKKRLVESGREFLSRNEKKDLKEEIKNMLLSQAHAVPNITDIVWDFENSLIWVYSTQKAANEEIESLFLKSFKLNLIKLFPYTLADFEGDLSDPEKDLLLKLKPSSFME
jgi:DNA recombination-dependent growth factor C